MRTDWHSEQSARVKYTRRCGEYSIEITVWRFEGGAQRVNWVVAAKGVLGSNGEAIDLEDAKAKSARALELVLELRSLQRPTQELEEP